MTQRPISSEIHLDLFRQRITENRRQAGHFQKDLATALGLDTGTLSRKLRGHAQMVLTSKEVKQIIKTLAQWSAITQQDEAIELLALMGLQMESFSPEEWRTAPLSDLSGPALPEKHKNIISPAQLEASFPSPRIPEPLTSFIGREEDTSEVCRLLKRADVRLLTLLGTAGVGKTRLSIAVAQQLIADFPDGIFFISLATVQDARLVPAKITETLHLNGPVHHEEVYTPSLLNILDASLREKRVMFILDNFEHLLAAAPFVGELLMAVPSLKILITSRTALRLYGENEWLVPPLSIANLTNASAVQVLPYAPAVHLFITRAHAVKRTLSTTEENIITIAGICHALDGIPLAIELAAARCKVLSPQTILHLLIADESSEQHKEERKSRHILSLFQHEAANVPLRHQSLIRTLDWSYDLLDEEMQELFLRLAVFLGGWTLSAARTICLVGEVPGTALKVAQCMERLVNHSLVVQEEGNEETETRFNFPEIIREYALERLNQSEMRDDLFQRHTWYYLALVERIEPDLSTSRRQLAVQALAREEGNVRAALHWVTEQQNIELMHRFCGALGLFWEARSQFAEAHTWLDRVVALDGPVVPLQRAKVLLAAARLAHWESNWEQARLFANQALQLYASCAQQTGKALAIFQIGDAWHMQGEYAQAITYFEQSLALYHDVKDWRNYAFTLSRLGVIDLLAGTFGRAQIRLTRSVELFRQYGDPWGLSVILTSLSVLYMLQGANSQALDYLYEALSYGCMTENSFNIALILITFGCVLGNVGQAKSAALICSAAEKIFASLGTALPNAYQPLYSRYKGQATDQIDAQIWQEWWHQGMKLSQAQAIMLTFQAYQSYQQGSKKEV